MKLDTKRIVEIPLTPVRLELKCGKCRGGKLAFSGSGITPGGLGAETLWMHKCSHCGREVEIQGETFPRVEYKDKQETEV